MIRHRGQGRAHELAIVAAAAFPLHPAAAAAAAIGIGYAEAAEQASHHPPLLFLVRRLSRLTAGISSTPKRASSWSHAPRGSRREEGGGGTRGLREGGGPGGVSKLKTKTEGKKRDAKFDFAS
jgi:hypothetical protein